MKVIEIEIDLRKATIFTPWWRPEYDVLMGTEGKIRKVDHKSGLWVEEDNEAIREINSDFNNGMWCG